MFKKLTILVVLAGLGYAAYWLWGAWALERDYTRWFEERREEGWQADYAALDLRGFPNRFDATWTDLTLVDPETGLGWQAPFFQLLMLSYRPNHVIAIWPETHDVLTPEGRVEIANDSLQASLVTAPGPDLPLERANLAAEAMTIRDAQGDVTALAALRAGIEREAAQEASYKIAFETDGLALAAPLLQRLGGDLPDAFKTARLDMSVGFDRPWGVSAIEEARPQPTAIELRVAEAEWGPMRLRLAGDLDIDSAGRAEGEITVQAQNWRDMLALADASGTLPRGMAGTLEDGLGLLAGLSGNSASLDIDLRLARGQVFLGPIPLGPAPVIRLR